jgi:hypothetical protein
MAKKGEYIQLYATNVKTGITYWLAKAQNVDLATQYVMVHRTNHGIYVQYDCMFDVTSRVEYDIMRFKRLQTVKKMLKNGDYQLLLEIYI